MSEGMDDGKRMGFWWHKQPAAGFYCIYRKRATENTSSCGLPDCPGIKASPSYERFITSKGLSAAANVSCVATLPPSIPDRVPSEPSMQWLCRNGPLLTFFFVVAGKRRRSPGTPQC